MVPTHALADKCDDVVEQASEIFDKAAAASKQGDYQEAATLYEKAATYYQKASRMKKCRCPKIANSSKKNVAICKENAANNRKRKKAEAEYGAYETYNKALDIAKQGHAYARKGQWADAIRSFEEAATIWESIASSQTENGKQARKAAEETRKHA
jgi:tetratricopeptide (TPR) repeat protein